MHSTTREVSTEKHGVGSLSGRVEIRDLRKTFVRSHGGPVRAIDGINLNIDQGQFCVFLGPSGCGKTTLLRCLAGLEIPDSGDISVGQKVLYSSSTKKVVAPQDRGMGMVFQSYALWPHMTVEQNVAFPMTTRRRRDGSREKVRDRVQHSLSTVGIQELSKQPVSALSGGQQQRVALARAISYGSDVICFDEPLSNVDAKVRIQLRQEILALQRELGFTAIYVTHDQEEAMEMADLLVVLKEGEVEQQGLPQEVYRRPVSRYVAKFIGSADTVVGKVVSNRGVLSVRTAIGEVIVSTSAYTRGLEIEQQVSIVVRAEDWQIVDHKDTSMAHENFWTGSVESVAFLGSSTLYEVKIDSQMFNVEAQGKSGLRKGQSIGLLLNPESLHVVTQ